MEKDVFLCDIIYMSLLFGFLIYKNSWHMMNMKLLLSMVSLVLFILGNTALAATSKCTFNGQEVDCAAVGEKIGGFLGAGLGIILLVIVLGIASTIFWILMLVHAIKHDVESKALWIVLMVFTGLIGALIYYFAVKRDFDMRQAGGVMSPTMPPTTPPTVS